MDYLKHFNLSDRPFKNTYDGRFFFRSQAAESIFAAVRDRDCPPLIHLKGAPKVGKTFVLRRLAAELRESCKVALWLNPHLTLAEMLRQALADLGYSHKFNSRTREEELLGYFQNAVSEAISDGYRLLWVVDNADELAPEFLAELYGLMELETHWRGKVALLLCGSPDNPWPLVPDNMMEARELSLPALDLTEAEEYVQARLKAAGAGAACFSRLALKYLWEQGRGLPETMNQLAERSLIAAWSAGRREVGPAQLKAARSSLEAPLALNRQALQQAARGQAVRADQPARGHPKRRLGPAALIMGLAVMGVLTFQNITTVQPSHPLQPTEPVQLVEEMDEPETATPATEPPGAETAGFLAPALPMVPPQLLTLPQSTLALVVEQDSSSGRLWQGGIRGPGLKAEVATPKFTSGGLYIFGRPRRDNPLVFQYPPAQTMPLEEARILWPRVATLLPQNVLPIIVAPAAEYNRPKDEAAEKIVTSRVQAWVQSQQYRFPDTMADLYAPTFQFFELGRPARTVNQEDFRRALNSEAQTSGEVNLAISQPLIMQDPGKKEIFWAVFNMKYDSRLRNDTGLRVLILEKSRGLGQDNWPIVADLWLPEKSLQE
ncbi:MAG: AAA family ATPase [Candidatus Adiutrix sp.]|jgi:type II secretory pathway predicted ATPase ExeA|nr:AAA family ATPase [Candidatus Adiutrix sp.]